MPIDVALTYAVAVLAMPLACLGCRWVAWRMERVKGNPWRFGR